MREKDDSICILNCEQVELFLNGESLGKQENTADKKNTLAWESALCSWNIESRKL